MPIFSRKPPHPFAGDHILITGGSAGLGLALARAFVRGNANVTLIGRSPDRLAAAAEDLRGLDCRRSGAVDPWVFTKAVDVTDGGKVRLREGGAREECAAPTSRSLSTIPPHSSFHSSPPPSRPSRTS